MPLLVSVLQVQLQGSLAKLEALALQAPLCRRRADLGAVLEARLLEVEAVAAALDEAVGEEVTTHPFGARERAGLLSCRHGVEDLDVDAFVEYVRALALGADVVTLAELVTKTGHPELVHRLKRHLRELDVEVPGPLGLAAPRASA